MGRAIVRNPSAFLMDEPLSNLDAKLRVQMRTEVSRLQNQLGTTTVYVTHDQTEAMTLGDRVAVMRAGVLQQVGTPRELYETPVNLFVAGFIGSPAMNFMPGTIEGGVLRFGLGEVKLTDRTSKQLSQHGSPERVIVGLRPEHFEDPANVGDDVAAHGVTFDADVDVVESMGSELYVYFRPPGGEQASSAQLDELAADAGTSEVPGAQEGQIVARLDPTSTVSQGGSAKLWVDVRKLALFDPDDGRSLTIDSERTERAPESTQVELEKEREQGAPESQA